MANTGIVKDRRYLNHKTGMFHPESPKRLEAIYEMLETPEMSEILTIIEPRPATHDEIALIHDFDYIETVARTAGKESTYLDPDTETSPESYETALLAVGGVLNAVDAVMEKRIDNAFCFIRPPGHHAEHDRAAGFCLFNNVAIAARYALNKFGIQRVLIVDWDLHHGNGTQNSFYEDSSVLYFSTHQYPFYPGSGGINEIGRGNGLGYTINVPLRSGPGDGEYVKIYRRLLMPVAQIFRPDLVLVSAGFDIYNKDPLGGMNVTPDGFARLMRVLLDIGDECCDGKVVVLLEGGYDLIGLKKSVKKVLEEMKGITHRNEDELSRIEADADVATDSVIKTVRDQIDPLWQAF